MPKRAPLTPTSLHVLLTLASGPQHGYALLKQAEQLGEGERPLGAGTLYAILKRLLEGALIAESCLRPNAELDDKRRRYYELTDLGRAAARDELRRLENVVRLGRSRRLLEDS